MTDHKTPTAPTKGRFTIQDWDSYFVITPTRPLFFMRSKDPDLGVGG